MELKQTGASPLYYLLEEQIRADIKNGIYKPGSRIPAEPELREMYNVSRITVRRAVEELCKEGLLEKKHGKGTYVRTQKINRKIEHLQSFSEACKASNMVSSSLITGKNRIPVSALELEKDFGCDSFIYTQRIRMADNEPVMCENNYFPSPKYDFLLNEDLSGSLYQLLDQKYDIKVTGSANSYLDIVRADAAIASLMKISKGDPLFYLNTEIYDEKGELIHIGHQYINGERYRFYLSDNM